MTDWTPPIDSGLSGSAYLSEQIEAFADGPSDAHHPAVYVLKCSVPSEYETAERRFRAAYADAEPEFREKWAEEPPEWVQQAVDASALLYVGAATDAYARLVEHAEGEHTPSVCKVFPVHSVWDVDWYDDVDRAFERESGTALSLRSQLPASVMVWQN